MKRWLWVVAVSMVFVAGAALAKDYTVQKKAGDYTVDITMDKNPPVTGTNGVEVVITDKAGKAVTVVVLNRLPEFGAGDEIVVALAPG